MKKDAIRRIIAKILILISIGLLCWPAASHISSAVKATHVSDGNAQSAAPVNEENAAFIEKAQRYNDWLADSRLFDLSDEELEWYMSLMNITGTGIMGRISIPKINVGLPIYHGVSDEVMQVGAGHMPGTSLPVVSDSSHVVISGHRGLATAAMFIDLPQLEMGDTFEITALGQVLTYEVDQIQTVWPEEVDVITIEPGMEYCTLVTCTPFGINNRRLLVRGHRIEAADAGDATSEETKTATDVLRDVLRGKVLAVHEVIMLGIALILFMIEFIYPGIKSIRMKIRKSDTN